MQQLKRSQHTLRRDEIDRIIHSTNNFRDRTIIKTLYFGGLRRQEAVDLKVEDIDFQNRRMSVTGKRNKIRLVDFVEMEYLGDMKHLVGKRKSGFVFTKNNGAPLKVRMINVITHKAGECAGVKNSASLKGIVNPHLFRHSIARHLKDKKVPMEFIQNFLGHESFKTTMDTYGTMDTSRMKFISDNLMGLKANNGSSSDRGGEPLIEDKNVRK